MKKNYNDRYKDYRPEVQTYMKKFLSYIISNYGDVHEEWWLAIDLIAQNYNLYLIGWDSIRTDGMYIVDNRNRSIRNPAITICKSMQDSLNKLMNEFGLTPAARKRMADNLNKLNSEQEANEYIDDLCGDLR